MRAHAAVCTRILQEIAYGAELDESGRIAFLAYVLQVAARRSSAGLISLLVLLLFVVAGVAGGFSLVKFSPESPR